MANKEVSMKHWDYWIGILGRPTGIIMMWTVFVWDIILHLLKIRIIQKWEDVAICGWGMIVFGLGWALVRWSDRLSK